MWLCLTCSEKINSTFRLCVCEQDTIRLLIGHPNVCNSLFPCPVHQSPGSTDYHLHLLNGTETNKSLTKIILLQQYLQSLLANGDVINVAQDESWLIWRVSTHFVKRAKWQALDWQHIMLRKQISIRRKTEYASKPYSAYFVPVSCQSL